MVNKRPKIFISACVIGKLKKTSKKEYPLEACGILLGKKKPNLIQVLEIHQVKNCANNPKRNFRFKMPNINYLCNSIKELKTIELSLVGIFHSHTICNNRPSIADWKLICKHSGLHVIIDYKGNIRIFANIKRNIIQ